MRKQQLIGTRLVATLGALLCFIVTSAEAQPGGGGFAPPATADDAEAAQREARPDRLLADGGRRSSRCSRRDVPAVHSVPEKNCMEWTNQSADFTFMAPSRLDPNQPMYKPEHWDKVSSSTCGRTGTIRS